MSIFALSNIEELTMHTEFTDLQRKIIQKTYCRCITDNMFFDLVNDYKYKSHLSGYPNSVVENVVLRYMKPFSKELIMDILDVVAKQYYYDEHVYFTLLFYFKEIPPLSIMEELGSKNFFDAMYKIPANRATKIQHFLNG